MWDDVVKWIEKILMYWEVVLGWVIAPHWMATLE